MKEYQHYMISYENADNLRTDISDAQSNNVSFYNPKQVEIVETPGTSAIVAADASGLTFSLTTTINLHFGSRIMIPETGIIMNNQMDDFSTPGKSNAFGYAPAEPNFIRPGKRPLSSIAPVIVENPDRSVRLVVAAAGGSRIITATTQTLWHMLDHGLTAAGALAKPRMHDQLVPDELLLEYDFDNQTAAFLQWRNHSVSWVAPGLSSTQAISIQANRTFEAASEPRQVNSGGFAI